MTGFTQETFDFLAGIVAHNEKAWFDAHKAQYERACIEPGKAFVAAVGPRLRELSPTVQFEPRVNASLWRINRDVRFSKDKRPYKDHFDLWFWHGERKGWNEPGFWVRLTAGGVQMGTGMWGFEKEQMESFRESVVHPRSGKALLAAVAEVRAAGPYEIGEKTRKLMPKGYEAPEDRAEYLLYSGLSAGTHLSPEAAMADDFVEVMVTHFTNCWPVSRWLMQEVAG